jgi:hypothetical protein
MQWYAGSPQVPPPNGIVSIYSPKIKDFSKTEGYESLSGGGEVDSDPLPVPVSYGRAVDSE